MPLVSSQGATELPYFDVPEEWMEKHVWSRVTKTPTCWLWQGQPNSDGYGVIQVPLKFLDAKKYSHGERRQFRVHILVWEQHNRRKVSRGFLLHHSCHTKECKASPKIDIHRVCVNWSDLREWTQGMNVAVKNVPQQVAQQVKGPSLTGTTLVEDYLLPVRPAEVRQKARAIMERTAAEELVLVASLREERLFETEEIREKYAKWRAFAAERKAERGKDYVTHARAVKVVAAPMKAVRREGRDFDAKNVVLWARMNPEEGERDG